MVTEVLMENKNRRFNSYLMNIFLSLFFPSWVKLWKSPIITIYISINAMVFEQLAETSLTCQFIFLEIEIFKHQPQFLVFSKDGPYFIHVLFFFLSLISSRRRLENLRLNTWHWQKYLIRPVTLSSKEKKNNFTTACQSSEPEKLIILFLALHIISGLFSSHSENECITCCNRWWWYHYGEWLNLFIVFIDVNFSLFRSLFSVFCILFFNSILLPCYKYYYIIFILAITGHFLVEACWRVFV